jgi:hypothetical protein
VRDGTVAEFVKSWEGVVSATVRGATPAGAHAAVVQVSLLRTDGSRLVTTQRIVVGGGPQPRIVAARLLSVSVG